MNIKVAFVSLGCPKNQIDGEVMLSKLASAGMEIVEEDIKADVVIVNTCAFIESAKKESIESILDVAWLRENHSLKGIVVTGCLAQRYGDELFKELPEVDAAVGVGNLDNIVEAVTFAYENGGKADVEKYKSVSAPECQNLGGDRVVTTTDGSVYIKISEGCDNHCTYCVIPSIRGKFRSRPIESIVNEAKELVSIGAKEIIVVSQDTTRYGIDLYGELALPKLLRELCKVDGLKWIRLLYCYPDGITDELIDTIATEEKIVNYLDMPIQHISDRILKLMNRKGDSSLIKEKIKLLHSKIPDLILRTTVIVGFPGEKSEDFAELSEFLKEARFERLGVFPYSEEEGTPAAKLEGKVSEKTKLKRFDTLMKNQMSIHGDHNKALVGKTLEVLCEGFDKPGEVYYGRSYGDAPEIDGKVYFTSSQKVKTGEFVKIEINEAMDYDLIGENKTK